MKVVTKISYKKQEPEHILPVDVVDRTGYVPLEVKYWEMMVAGIQLENIRTTNYGYDRQSILNKIDEVGLDKAIESSSLRSPYVDKQTADTLLRQKLDKYRTIKSRHDRIKELKERYDSEMAQKARDEELFNKWKLEQYEKKLNNT